MNWPLSPATRRSTQEKHGPIRRWPIWPPDAAVLSKAMLLAKDTEITDPTITRQLKR